MLLRDVPIILCFIGLCIRSVLALYKCYTSKSVRVKVGIIFFRDLFCLFVSLYNRPKVQNNSSLKPVLNWANVCSPNILQTVRRTMIRFLTELLVRRTWLGQFDELYFVLIWLVMRCKLRPELAEDAQQTA